MAQTSIYTHTWSSVTAHGQVVNTTRACPGQQAHPESTEGCWLAPWAEPTAGAYHGSALPPAGESPQATALPLPPGIRLRSKGPLPSLRHQAFVETMRLAGGSYVPKPGQSPQTLALSHTHLCDKTMFRQAWHLRNRYVGQGRFLMAGFPAVTSLLPL